MPDKTLAMIRAAGLKARLDGDKLMIGPKEKLTPELTSAIREHKQGLLVLLAGDFLPAPMNDSELPSDSPDGLCYLVRAGDGTIKAVPMSWLDNQARLAMEVRP